MESKDILTLAISLALITGVVVIIKAWIAECLSEEELKFHLAMLQEENARMKIFAEAMRQSSGECFAPRACSVSGSDGDT
jgi:hypothetical protein